VIVVDTSAIIAVLYREPGLDRFVRAIAEAESCFLSAVGYFEAAMVLIGRSAPEAAMALDSFVERSAIELVPFDDEQAKQARDAFIRFGKGRHPAALNFGDCVSYALAQARGLPLLYKGDDFAKTDVISAAGRNVSG
jgi:ribonuclease VapC